MELIANIKNFSPMEILDHNIRIIRSDNFNIITGVVQDLEKKIRFWFRNGELGGMVVGRTRAGKSRAIRILAEKIRNNFLGNGIDFPVLCWTITDHKAIQTNFYRAILNVLGVFDTKALGKIGQLKQRAYNELAALGNNDRRQVVLLIDEAWRMSENDFAWLMDFSNYLAMHYDIILSCFLFGTKELYRLKSKLESLGKKQITQRFMEKKFDFIGIKDEAEMALCLKYLDDVMIELPDHSKTDISLKQFAFPDAPDKKTFFSLFKIYHKVFMQIRDENNIKESDIPMYYFISSFTFLLQLHSSASPDPVVFPTEKEIREAILETGFSGSGEK